MPVEKRLGHLPSKPGYAGTHGAFFASLVSPVGAVVRNGNRTIIERAVPLPVFDQGSLGSCEWQSAVAGCAMVTDDPLRSALAGYLESLFADGAYLEDGTLDDRGTTAETVHRILADVGVCSEEEWRYHDDGDWQKRPPVKALQNGWRSRRAITHAIFSLGRDRGEDVRASIDAGRPVQIGGQVNRAYMDAAPGSVWSRFDATVGGHAQLVVGYEARDSDFLYIVRNSWNAGWCGAADLGGHSYYSLAGLNEQDEVYSFAPKKAA